MSFMHLSMAQQLHQVEEYESPTRQTLTRCIAAVQPWFAGQAGNDVAEQAWDVVCRERARIETFLDKEAFDYEELSQIDTLFRKGIELQVEACVWLGAALQQAQPDACTRAQELLAAGDRLIAAAQDAHNDLSNSVAIAF